MARGSRLAARGSWLVNRGSTRIMPVRIRLSVHQSDERTDVCRSSGWEYLGSNHEPRAASREPRRFALRRVASRRSAAPRNAMRCDTEKLPL